MSDWALSGVAKKVVDGDTVHVEVDLFSDEKRTFDVRLLEVNCPEAKAPGGAEATAFTQGLLFPNGSAAPVVLKTKARRDRYGRLLAYVEVGGADLSEAIIAAGHGVKVEYSAHIAELTKGGR